MGNTFCVPNKEDIINDQNEDINQNDHHNSLYNRDNINLIYCNYESDSDLESVTDTEIRQINELLDKCKELENENKKLKNKIEENKKHNNIKINDISEEKINEYIDDILKNDNINVKYLPDSVEKAIYKNIFTIAIHLLDNIMDSTSINLLGHQIKINLTS